MKKIFFALIAIASSFYTVAQTDADSGFNERVGIYLNLSREGNFDRLMDYVHPALFKHSSREELVTMFKRVYDNKETKITIDSSWVTELSEDFKSGTALYKKIDYQTILQLRIKDSAAANNTDNIVRVGDALKLGFPGGQIRFNKSTGSFEITAPGIMIAIKDNESSPWMFLGYQRDASFLKALFPQEVIDHFKLL